MLYEPSPNRLCLLRKQHGLSQKQLASLTGLDRTMISIYERGRTLPTFASAAMFQIIFGLNIADIFPALFRELEAELESKERKLGRRLLGRRAEMP